MGDLIRTTQHHEDTFICEICFEPVTLPNNKFNNSRRCFHPFCTPCIIKYIRVKLEDNVSDIKCPHNNCNHYLEPLPCRPILDNQLFNKWCDVLCESTLSGFDMVYCPNKECSELIINEFGDANLKRCKCSELIINEFGDANLKRCMCPACLNLFCFQCKVPWHTGYTCEETGHGKDYEFLLLCEKSGWKRCPKCKQCIEKLLGGCNIVKCRCRHKFCYKCGKKVPFWRLDEFYSCSCPTLFFMDENGNFV